MLAILVNRMQERVFVHERFNDRYYRLKKILPIFLGAVHLAGPIAKISKGLCKLSLSHCGLTAKGVNQMAHSLSLNQSISNSLTYLDLSGNNLKDDINVSSIRSAQKKILRVGTWSTCWKVNG